jgi:hypothetical protein
MFIINILIHLVFFVFLIIGFIAEFAIQRFKNGREIAKILMRKLDKTVK